MKGQRVRAETKKNYNLYLVGTKCQGFSIPQLFQVELWEDMW